MAVAPVPETAVFLPEWARTAHLHLIGQPGTGKTRAIESMAMQNILSGRGVVVVDVHGDLFDSLLSRVARLAVAKPEIAQRTILVNPIDPLWTVGFDPLEGVQGHSSERLAGFLTDVMIKIWKIDPTEAPRMVRLMSFTFFALASAGLKLVDLPRFLTDPDWREDLLTRVTNPDVHTYFRYEFPKTEGGAMQWGAPVLNKIGAFLFDNDLKLMFSTRSTIHFRRILEERSIVLVNLSKGLLGEENSALLGAFIVAHLQKAALARAAQKERPPYYVYLDEFANYTTSNIQDILSESRKYALSLVLAHQYLGQLPPEILGAVLNTTGTLACFRVGYQDATVLARELFPPKYLERAHWELDWWRIGRTPILIPRKEYDPLSFEEMAAVLTHQAPREFWVKHKGPYVARHLRTLEVRAPVLTEELCRAREALVYLSMQRYGRLKAEVRRDVAERRPGTDTLDGQFRVLTDYETR